MVRKMGREMGRYVYGKENGKDKGKGIYMRRDMSNGGIKGMPKDEMSNERLKDYRSAKIIGINKMIKSDRNT